MVSDALTEPPGESTRSTIADTESSAAASRRPAATVSPPALDEPNGNTREPPRPLTIGPATVTTANVGLGLRPGIDGRADPPGPVARAYRLKYRRGGAVSSSASPDPGETPSALVAELPSYTIVKDKYTVPRERLPTLNESLQKRWPEAKANRLD